MAVRILLRTGRRHPARHDGLLGLQWKGFNFLNIISAPLILPLQEFYFILHYSQTNLVKVYRSIFTHRYAVHIPTILLVPVLVYFLQSCGAAPLLSARALVPAIATNLKNFKFK